MTKSCVEIELTNGHRTVIPKEWDKFYNIKEKTRTSLKLIKQFPFIEVLRHPVVSFKFRTEYEYLNSILDSKYTVNCSLVQLAKLFDANITPFEKTLVGQDLMAYG